METFLRILLATGAPTLPQMIGGSQRTGDTLLKQLAKRGHHVALTAGLIGKGWLGLRGRALMRLTGNRAIKDHLLGYTAYRSWFPWQTAEEVARRFSPEIVIVQAHATGKVAFAFRDAGQNVVFNFQDNEFRKLGRDLRDFGTIRGVANSDFTAQAYRSAYGAYCRTIYPLIDRAAYVTAGCGKYVTFINPNPVKGLEKALEIAALLPTVPFRFQETWPMPSAERGALRDRLAQMPNVTLAPKVDDMRDVYAATRVLLVPSKWEEGYGRIASEAQFSGIPVVGSDRGGLPEAIGQGGIILGADDPASAWAQNIQSLYDNSDLYSTLAMRAREHANRETLQIEKQIDAWEDMLAAYL